MAEAIYNDQDIFAVTPELIADLKRRALASPRQRFRICLHHSNDHRTHEMIIVFRQGTFMPPHRHPEGKSESYHVIEGAMTVYLFNDQGRATRTIKMAQYGGRLPFMYRLSTNAWHMPVATSEWLVYHETYSGPFDKEADVEFPAWVPSEEDRPAVRKFLAGLESEI